ncbi:hypothetical protein ACLBWZ_14745 [Brucellaceae bacterium C25G]
MKQILITNLCVYFTLLLFLNTTYAMNDNVINQLQEFLNEDNAQEINEQRDYYKYAVKTQGETRPFEEFKTVYGPLGSFGTPASDDVIKAFAPTIPFPPDLIDFYRKHGSLRGMERQLNINILDLTELNNNRIKNDNEPLFRSLGLVDMIEYFWDERDQIKPESGESIFTPEEIKQINANYQVVGYWLAINESNEALNLLYYDKTGRFGIAYLHQDDWDIGDLLVKSGAQYSFSDALEVYLNTVKKLNNH